MLVKRWPIIRHVRYWLEIGRLNNQYYELWTAGMSLADVQGEYDRALEIWRGER